MTTQVSPDLISPLVLPGRNALINGNFEIWQRGTSFAGIGAVDGPYTADRWSWSTTGTQRFTLSRDASVPTFAQAGVIVPYSFKAACTTAQASPASTDYLLLNQKIEGYVWRKFWQRPVVVSFWVKASQTGLFGVSVMSGGLDRAYFGTYTVNVANTWEYKTLAVPASPSAGTWDLGNGIGAYLSFGLSTGSSHQGTPGGWQTVSGAYAPSGCNNLASSTSNVWQVAAVQLEVGVAPSEFEDVPFDLNLARCMRYYEKTFEYATAPAQAVGNLTPGAIIALASGTTCTAPFRFAVRKRGVPLVTTYNPTQANSNWRNTNNNADATPTPYLHSESLVQLQANAATDVNLYQIHATADAEL